MMSLPNHYIPDAQGVNGSKTSATLNFSQRPLVDRERISQEFHQRLPQADASRNLMELTDRPPAHVYHNYPHIIIGGQPFYLIPSDPGRAEAYEIDSYAYPQSVPIYEEIDNSSTAKCPSECSASDQGEIGSLRRGEQDLDLNQSPRLLPVNNNRCQSRNTNSSDLSSSDTSANNNKHLGPRIRVNPLLPTRETPFQDTSFSDSYESNASSNASSSQKENNLRKGLATSSNRARFPRKSPASNSTSSTSSIYYYSDTLRKKEVQPPTGDSNKLNHPDLSDLVLVDTQVIFENDQKARKSTTQV